MSEKKCVEEKISCTDTTISSHNSAICSEIEKSPGNICYFDGESCKEANSCENIINKETTPVTNDLCNLLSTEDYKCIVDDSATNKCRKHFYCEKAPYESENLCSSYLVKTQGKICKKSTTANACVEEEETTSQDGENTKENTGNEGRTNESNSKNNSTSNDKAETENGNILKITFSIFCLIFMLWLKALLIINIILLAYFYYFINEKENKF